MPARARHSEELKIKIVQCFEAVPRPSYGEVAKRFMVPKPTVAYIMKKYNETNSVENRHGGIYITIKQRLSVQLFYTYHIRLKRTQAFF